MSVFESANSDLLDRGPLIAAYTRLLEAPAGPRVISVEAGYGQGKTVFAKLWHGALQDSPHVPIIFNAWEADNEGDPLMAFLAALTVTVPAPGGTEDKQGRGEQLWKASKALAMTSARTLGRAVLREGMDELTDGIGKILNSFKGDIPADLQEEFEAVAKFAEGQDGKLDEALVRELSTQFASMRLRLEMRRQTLTRIHDALVEQKDGKVIVIIDELDRCRPDFAIELLEAIKHLFDEHDGFRFALMVNVARLENAAAARFGPAADGERYLTKFIDQRLHLPTTDLGNMLFIAFLADPARMPKFESWVDPPDDPFETFDIAGFAQGSGFTLREIEGVFRNIRTTLSFYPEQPIDLLMLTLMAFAKIRDNLTMPDLKFDEVVRHHPAVHDDTIGLGDEKSDSLYFEKLYNGKSGPRFKFSQKVEQHLNLQTMEDHPPRVSLNGAFMRYHLNLLEKTQALMISSFQP